MDLNSIKMYLIEKGVKFTITESYTGCADDCITKIEFTRRFSGHKVKFIYNDENDYYELKIYRKIYRIYRSDFKLSNTYSYDIYDLDDDILSNIINSIHFEDIKL